MEDERKKFRAVEGIGETGKVGYWKKKELREASVTSPVRASERCVPYIFPAHNGGLKARIVPL